MSKQRILDLAKYLLAVLLLVWVVRSNWAPQPTRAVASLAVSSVGLCAPSSGPGPVLAASAALPDRGKPRGLGYVWQRHVVQGQPISTLFLLAGGFIYVVAILITLLRWYLLVRALDLSLTIRDALRYGMIGIFFNTFLPGSVGGDIIKAAALARTQTRRTAAVATVIMDRLIALWALVWFVALLGSVFWLTGLLTGPSAAVATSIVSVALVVVAVSLGIWLLLGLLPTARAERFAGRLARLPLVGASASELWLAVWMYRQRQHYVAAVMLLSWVGQLGFVLAFYCCACVLWSPDLGPIPSLTQHFLLVPIGLVMQAIIPTPGGAGAGEWGFAALYLLFNAAEANGVLGSLVQRVLTWILGLVGYGVYIWMRPGMAPAAAEKVPARADGSTLRPAPASALAGSS